MINHLRLEFGFGVDTSPRKRILLVKALFVFTCKNWLAKILLLVSQILLSSSEANKIWIVIKEGLLSAGSYK